MHENTNDEKFAVAVQNAIVRYRIPITEFMDKFGVSRGTVLRWAQAKSLPCRLARPRILKWIRKTGCLVH
jgi:hypothetical protein